MTVIDLANRDRVKRRPGVRTLIAGFVFPLVFLALFAPSLFADARLFLAQYGNDRYAFYLASGHTFYGTVRGVGFGKVVLADAYSFQSVSVGETSTNNLTAQKDNPLTRPDNWLVINREHILFYERVGDEASLLQAIRPQ